MAHYAKVLDQVVTKVIVAEPEFFESFVDDTPGTWIKTSYNIRGGVYYDPATGQPAEDQSVIDEDEARQRKNYARIGGYYDDVGFYEPQPFPSWTLDNTTYIWHPPIPYPSDGQVYDWDEDAYQADNTTGWVLVE